jgi:hypothetical protein
LNGLVITSRALIENKVRYASDAAGALRIQRHPDGIMTGRYQTGSNQTPVSTRSGKRTAARHARGFASSRVFLVEMPQLDARGHAVH